MACALVTYDIDSGQGEHRSPLQTTQKGEEDGGPRGDEGDPSPDGGVHGCQEREESLRRGGEVEDPGAGQVRADQGSDGDAGNDRNGGRFRCRLSHGQEGEVRGDGQVQAEGRQGAAGEVLVRGEVKTVTGD